MLSPARAQRIKVNEIAKKIEPPKKAPPKIQPTNVKSILPSVQSKTRPI